MIVAGFAAQLLLVMAVVVAPALLARGRLAASYRAWGWGAVTFAGAFATRTAILLALTPLANKTLGDLSPESATWINLAVLSITAGVFEEGARWVVLRRFARDIRQFNNGVMYGLGHGGLEALLIVGLAAVANIVLLVGGEQIVARMSGDEAAAAEAMRGQLQTLRDTPAWMPILAVWERVLAMTFHVAAALLVLRGVRDERVALLAYAISLHVVVNAVAIATATRYGLGITEIVLTILTFIPLAIIVREWRSYAADDARGGARQHSLP